MFYAIFTVHVLLCVGMIGLVLIQQGKGADAGAILGGGGADSVLGASAGNMISKITTSLAIGFMITSILLVKSYQTRSFTPNAPVDPLAGSVMEQEVAVPPAQEEAAPAKEEPAAE